MDHIPPRRRRLSILKRIDNANTVAPTSPTVTRRISFHGKKSVKEFYEGTDKATIWQDSYEEEAAHGSNEPLPGASAFMKSGTMTTTHLETTATAAVVPLALQKGGADEEPDSKEMSLTFIENGAVDAATAVGSGWSQSCLMIGDDMEVNETNANGYVKPEPPEEENYDDVQSFNRSLDRLSFDNESLDDDDMPSPSKAKVNMNRTKFLHSADSISFDSSTASGMSMDAEVVDAVPLVVSKSRANRTKYGADDGETMNLTTAAFKAKRGQGHGNDVADMSPDGVRFPTTSSRLSVYREVPMDVTVAVKLSPSRIPVANAKRLHQTICHGRDETGGSLDFTRLDTAEPANKQHAMDLTQMPVPKMQKLADKRRVTVHGGVDDSLNLTHIPAARSNRNESPAIAATDEHGSDMDWSGPEAAENRAAARATRPASVLRQLQMADVNARRKSAESGSADRATTTTARFARQSLAMNMTQGAMVRDISLYIDESLLMPRDLLSSTKIHGSAMSSLSGMEMSDAAASRAHESELRVAPERAAVAKATPSSTPPAAAVVHRKSVIRRHTSSDHLQAAVVTNPSPLPSPPPAQPIDSPADPTTQRSDQQQLRNHLDHIDQQRFDRTLHAINDECQSGISDSASGDLIADNDSSMGLFRSAPLPRKLSTASTTTTSSSALSSSHTTAELCNLIEPPSADATPAAASTSKRRFSCLNQYFNLTDIALVADDCGTPTPPAQPLDTTFERPESPGGRRCSIGTPAETEATLCRCCAKCRRRESDANDAAPAVRAAAAAPASPLGSMASLLPRAVVEATDEDSSVTAALQPPHYEAYELISQYASTDEVFASYRKRMEHMMREREERRMRISHNVPSPGWVALTNNVLDAEFAIIERNRQDREEGCIGAPFPYQPQIDYLLGNVFETVSLPWHYDDFLFARGVIRVWHDSIPSVILSLRFDVPATNSADLRFKQISLQQCHESLNCMPPLALLHHNELLAGLPFELTGLCPTSVQFLPFLQRLDTEHFRVALATGRQIWRLVGENDAHLGREHDGTCYIERKLFDGDRMERTVLSVKLKVVAATTLQQVYVLPARTIRDAATLTHFGSGLACIEHLLTDPWSYLVQSR